MKDQAGRIIITDKTGKVIRASKIQEIVSDNENPLECMAILEDKKKLKIPLSMRQVMRYLSKVCNQKTAG